MFQDYGQCIPSSPSTTATSSITSEERDMNTLTLDLSLSSHTREVLQFCYYRLLTRGAQVTTHFHTGVTHILIPPSSFLASPDMFTHRVYRIQERLKLLNLGAGGGRSAGSKSQNVKIVYPEWIEESIRTLTLAEVTPNNAYVSSTV